MPAPAVVAVARIGVVKKLLRVLAPVLLFVGALVFVTVFLFMAMVTTTSAPASLGEGGAAPAIPVDAEPGSWIVPVSEGYSITSVFGYRPDVYPHQHWGIDFSMSSGCGATVVAASSGTVTFSGWTTGGWGNRILISHPDGTQTGYAHMANGSLLVTPGTVVTTGQPLALEGNTGVGTGCHLHFETFVGGARVNPVPFMAARGVTL